MFLKDNFPKYSYAQLKTILQQNQYDPIATYQYLDKHDVNWYLIIKLIMQL